MGNRARELDVPHALAAHLGLGDFNAALLADDAAMLEPLVFAAETFVVLDRTKIFAQKSPSRSGLNVR